MEIKVLENSKNETKVELENVTLAEILRVYLNKDSAVSLAVWRRGHLTENPVLVVKTKGKTAKKAIADAANSVIKDLNSIESDFKKLK
jgi:DNA-directed RNA polymerase subunit L